MISKLLGGKDEKDCANQVRKFLTKIDLTQSLGDQGVLESDIDWMAQNCLKVSVGSMGNHPIVFGQEDIRRIYKKAL